MFASAISAGLTAYAQQASHRDTIWRERQRCLQMRRAMTARLPARKVVPLAGYIGAMQISGTFYPIRMGKTNIPEVKHGNR